MTPCIAMWVNSGLGTLQFPVDPNKSISGHRSLIWRIGQLTQCSGLRLEMIHRGHFIKANATHYFARAEAGIWAGKPYDYFATEKEPGAFFEKWRLVAEPWKGSGSHVCFYLGKYPVYWKSDNSGVVFADEMVAGDCYAMGVKPWIRGVDMGVFEGIEPGRRSLYFSDAVIKTYARQMEFFNYWRGWQSRCIADQYPPEPFRKTYVKGTKMEWPGRSPYEIEMPTPEEVKPAEVLPPELKESLPAPAKLILRIQMRQTWQPNPDKLLLSMVL